jgi:hypothetical protein
MSRDAYLIWGNHASTSGIGEVAFTVASSVGDRYALRASRSLVPGELNIIIDEFCNPHFVSQLSQVKRADPATRYVIVATEFITPISILGLELTRTFNFFWGATDWINLAANLRQGANRLPTYMHRRYLGFVEALKVCDLLAFVHPSIGDGIPPDSEAFEKMASPPVAIYPELLMAMVGPKHLPIGFDITGTMTAYRKRVVRSLEKQFRRARWPQTIWRHVSFQESKSLELANARIKFHYDWDGGNDHWSESSPPQQATDQASGKAGGNARLFNLNPPQRAGWPYSSPMRILRAAMLGQIPVVTKRFNDHEIEDIAWLWDGRLDSALKVIHLAMDRKQFVGDYLQSVQRYNAIAKEKNRPFLEALDRLMALKF